MAVKIRLKRMGKIRSPHYRIVVADSKTRRDGRVIEEIGKYHPKNEPSLIEVESERAQYWLSVGAQPTEAVEALLKVTGDWQKFKGESGTEGSLKVAEPKRSKQDIFNEILKETHSDLGGEATTSAKKGASKKPTKAADSEGATESAVEATGGDAAVEDTPAAEATGASSEGTDKPAEPQAAETESAKSDEA